MEKKEIKTIQPLLNIKYQKTDFNSSLICQLPTIFKCSNSRCKKNNNIFVDKHIISQNCLFCGTPNYINKFTFFKSEAKS
jgi:hypothetical protein